MNPYCTEINFSIHPLKDNIDPLLLPKVPHQLLDVDKFLNPEISNLLISHGVHIGLIEAFMQWQYPWKSFIHIDDKGTDISKLNWVFGGADSSVKWYQIKAHATHNPATTIANTGTMRFDPQDVEKILHTHPAGIKPFIFQAGIPHQACAGLEPRCCISMIPCWIKNNKRLSYAELVNILAC